MSTRCYNPGSKFPSIVDASERPGPFYKVVRFNKYHTRCEHFTWKVKEDSVQMQKVAYCSLLDKSCKYFNCPNKEAVLNKFID